MFVKLIAGGTAAVNPVALPLLVSIATIREESPASEMICRGGIEVSKGSANVEA